MRDIAVCVKIVPMNIAAETIKADRTGVELNVADMAAVEAALRLKKKDCMITVFTMGTKAAYSILKDLLSRGVDRVVLLTDRKMAGADTYATGFTLAAAIRYFGSFDCIFCGRRAIDGETGQVPGELAGRLKIPCITDVSRIEINEGRLYCDRLLETGTARLEAVFPAVISFCEYSYPLRLPSIQGKRAAAKKEVICLSADELGMEETQCGVKGSRTKVLDIKILESGFRNGMVERNIEAGVERMISIVNEMRK